MNADHEGEICFRCRVILDPRNDADNYIECLPDEDWEEFISTPQTCPICEYERQSIISDPDMQK
jgi:hypothetical protein